MFNFTYMCIMVYCSVLYQISYKMSIYVYIMLLYDTGFEWNVREYTGVFPPAGAMRITLGINGYII